MLLLTWLSCCENLQSSGMPSKLQLRGPTTFHSILCISSTLIGFAAAVFSCIRCWGALLAMPAFNWAAAAGFGFAAALLLLLLLVFWWCALA
jgi:hypothetical protein